MGQPKSVGQAALNWRSVNRNLHAGDAIMCLYIKMFYWFLITPG
jgi:hypothetical protein